MEGGDIRAWVLLAQAPRVQKGVHPKDKAGILER